MIDQGIGIPPEELDRIFERFYRVDPARHRSTGGTGLGLSIVKHVAATHGGDVSVWSVEGQGSTFTLTLPRSNPAEQRPLQPDDGHDQEGTRDPRARRRGRRELLRRSRLHAAQGGLRGGDRGHRPRGAGRVRRDRRRHRAAGPDAPRHARHRGVPPDPADLQRAGDHGLREGRRDRQGGRAWSWAPTTTSPSPTPPASWSPGSARCCVAARRPDLAPDTLEAGPVRMDVERHVVTVDGAEQRLPLKEFELLEMFLRNPGRVLTRGQLIDRVWGSDYVGDTKTLDVHVKRLRAKLEPDPSRAEVPRHRARAGLQARPLTRRLTAGGRAVRNPRVRHRGRHRRVRHMSTHAQTGTTAGKAPAASWLPLAAVAFTLVKWASAFVAIRHVGRRRPAGRAEPRAAPRGRGGGAGPPGPRPDGFRGDSGRRHGGSGPSWCWAGSRGSRSTTWPSTRRSGASTPAPPPCWSSWARSSWRCSPSSCSGSRLTPWLVVGLAVGFGGVVLIGRASSERRTRRPGRRPARGRGGRGVRGRRGDPEEAARRRDAGPGHDLRVLRRRRWWPACPSPCSWSTSWGTPGAADLWWIVYLGVFPTAIAFTTWAYALAPGRRRHSSP